jgi:hypothetical protein
MKCRKWGHFASDCIAEKDTCGTCGGEHRTSACTNTTRRHCVSCKSDSHTSWDRNCPEFKRKCVWYDDKHPENKLRYFPTEDEWTKAQRPERIPIPERFPARYAVGSLPPPNKNGRELPTRQIEERPKRNQRKGKSKTSKANRRQPTIEKYFTPSQNTTLSRAREEGEVEQEDEEEEFISANLNPYDISNPYSAVNLYAASTSTSHNPYDDLNF